MKKLFATMTAAALCGAFALGLAACTETPKDANDEMKTYTYSVYAPDGAPALALCNFIANGAVSETYADKGVTFKYDFHVVDASLIQTYVTGENPAADFCVLPVNAAAKILGSGETYKLLGTVTNGNLYFLTTGDNAVLTPENFEAELVGKKVGVVQLENVPGLTLKAVLKNKCVSATAKVLESVQEEADPNCVNLVAFTPDNVTPKSGCDYYLCPEPAASAKIKGTNGVFKLAGDLQELYGGDAGYPQAALVVKNSVIEDRSYKGGITAGGVWGVDEAKKWFAGSAEYLAAAEPATLIELLADKRTAGLTPSFNANNLTKEVVAHCSVRFTPALECRESVKTFLQMIIDIGANTAIPSDNFWYTL